VGVRGKAPFVGIFYRPLDVDYPDEDDFVVATKIIRNYIMTGTNNNPNKILSVSKTRHQNSYFTPKYAWEHIKDYIPKNKVIWEAFFDPKSKSPTFLRELGFTVVCKEYKNGEGDFFQMNMGDIVVSNPPFDDKKMVLKRLKELDKPFILILPSACMNSLYFRKLFFDDEELGIIIPRKRIHFINGEDENKKSSCCFDCYYFCWKVGVKGINWIK